MHSHSQAELQFRYGRLAAVVIGCGCVSKCTGIIRVEVGTMHCIHLLEGEV